MPKKKVVDELETTVAEAQSTSGRTPREITVIVRELAKVLEGLKLTSISRIEIGTYFLPHEGQLGVEGLIQVVQGLMNEYITAGWQPWHMFAQPSSRSSFILNGMQTGDIEGERITIIWALPSVGN